MSVSDVLDGTAPLVDAATGQGVPGLSVFAGSVDGFDYEQFGALLTGGGFKTDAAGHFTVDKLGSGSGSLYAVDAGFLSGTFTVVTKKFTLGPGEKKDLGIIRGLGRPPKPETPGDLGMTATEHGQDLILSEVTPGGPAAQAGLVVGEHILSVSGNRVADFGTDVVDQLLSDEFVGAGQSVTVTVERAGKSVDVIVVAQAEK